MSNSSSSSATRINVAVAGVTSGLGQAIASALLSPPYSKSLSVTLLTRHSLEPNPLLEPLVAAGGVVKEVDYTSIPSITSALQGIHTVICTVHGVMGDLGPAHNLIEGAKAAGVKRFAPSEFFLPIEAAHKLSHYASSKVPLWEHVQNSGMEYTAFSPGGFMDYLAFGAPVAYEGPLRLFPLFDFAQRKAEISGTGDELITMTLVEDIGKFVAAACVDQSRWPVESGMSGDTTTFNRIIQEAEAVLGEKIAVTYISKEALAERGAARSAEGNTLGAFYDEVMIAFANGKAEVSKPILNEKFGDIVKPAKVADVLKKYWGKD